MIKLVCFDFDGVFTDGKIYYSNENLNKNYNIKDGMGLSLLRKNNIKIGLITGFKNKNYTINNESSEIIFKHLNFDFIKTGVENKLNVMDEWITHLKITYEDVAYIGDDINDIDIMKKVKYSSCPSDAVDECKDIVDYICEKKGGDGCVREFCNYVVNLNLNSEHHINILKQIKLESQFQLQNINLIEIESISNILYNAYISNKIIYCTGVGKSENISIHLSNLLKSIGIRSFYLNCLNSTHGDIGTIRNGDVVLIFSKSGNTCELINIINHLKSHEPYLISISCNQDGNLNKLCDFKLILPFSNELNSIENINTIPTNSYMSMLYFTNILIIMIANKINLIQSEYKLNHPGGSIGFQLKLIKDIMIKEFPKLILNIFCNLSDILLEMTKYSIGCCFFVNEFDELIGILSDGDIRRLICANKGNIITNENINKNFHYETDLNKMYYEIENIKKYKFIPILENKKIIGIIKS